MPTYVYRREDGSTFEVIQRITADSLTVCPTTYQKVHRVLSGGTGFILKGSGFYKTDYVSNGRNTTAEKAQNKKAESKKEDSSTAETVAAKDDDS